MDWAKLGAKLQGAVRSFTIWFNGMMALAIANIDAIKESLPSLQQLDHRIYSWALGVTLAVNVWARAFKTKGALEDKVPPKPNA